MKMDPFDLTGRVAIVTGGNGGIGLGMARGLARAGARVMIAGRDAGKGEAARAELSGLGAEAAFMVADVTDEAACRALVAGTVERFGRLDILVANAGIAIRKQPEAFSPAEWHAVIDTNLSSAFLCAQAAYPELCKAGGGKIIVIGSMLTLFGMPLSVPYAASKGGIVQMARGLATAWAKDRIQVNAILPGWIDTDLTVTAREQVAGLNDRVMTRTPAGRWGVPDDFAGVAVFLASSASDFLTGTAIPVDGGYSVQG